MTEEVAPLLAPLSAVERLLLHCGALGMIIGGVAASLLGKPRLTADVDVLVLFSTDRLPDLIAAAASEGLELRFPDAEAFARQHRVLLLRHRASGISVDISLGLLPFEVEALQRSTPRELGTVTLRLPTAEDLIILKAVAHRPQDLLDIQGVIAAHPQLDCRRIERWVKEFAEALQMPQLWNDISSWLT